MKPKTGATKARHYLSRWRGVRGFFSALESRGVNYVVLRWFETLPKLARGEDIDILVADENLEELRSLLTGGRRWGIKVDVYSASGLPGSVYRGLPYFPEKVSREILERATVQAGGVRVPAPREHFLSMVFHCLYHKGMASGLPAFATDKKPAPQVDHDYRGLLPVLAERCGLAVPSFDLETLDGLMEQLGWRPRLDTMEKWAARNDWLKHITEKSRPVVEPELHGLIIFIVRERGVPYLDAIRKTMWDEGLNIVAEAPLDETARARATAEIRGGNWGRGPHSENGGLPAHVIVAFDVFPIAPTETTGQEHPGISNERIVWIKRAIRGIANQDLDGQRTTNVIHSSDHPAQALEYLGVTLPGAKKTVVSQGRNLLKAFRTPYPVLKDLSGNSRRAKVELVDFHGTQAVCKTFRPGREEFLANELKARAIPGVQSMITPVLEQGPLHIVIKKASPNTKRGRSPFPPLLKTRFLAPRLVHTPRALLLTLRTQGYELLDFRTSNWFFEDDGSMLFTDLEFLTFTGEPKKTLEGCLAWYPLPADFSGRRPKSRWQRKNPYGLPWLTYLGLPRFLAVRHLPIPIVYLVQFLTSFAIVGSKLGTHTWRMYMRIKENLRQLLRRRK